PISERPSFAGRSLQRRRLDELSIQVLSLPYSAIPTTRHPCLLHGLGEAKAHPGTLSCHRDIGGTVGSRRGLGLHTPPQQRVLPCLPNPTKNSAPRYNCACYLQEVELSFVAP